MNKLNKAVTKKNIFTYLLVFKLFLLSCILALTCCKQKVVGQNFNNWKNTQYKNSFFKFNSEEEIFFNDDFPLGKNLMIGKLEFNKNLVFFKSNSNEKFKFVLFNFNLSKNQCEQIIYSKSISKVKKYSLCIQDVFYDKAKKNTIYKFCFKNYNLFIPNSSLVFFVTKKKGVIGHYLIENSKPEKICERMFGEVFKDRYHYNQFEFFSLK